MNTKRALTFVATLLFVGLAVAGPAGAAPAEQGNGSDGPVPHPSR